MKKILFSMMCAILLPLGMMAQTVTLTFTGKDANNLRVQLDRVSVTNLTKGWQETIYWPDTTLTMWNSIGIDDYANNGGFVLSQNNPNPFNGTTDVLLTVADAGMVTLEITDVNGRTAVETVHAPSLQAGTHQFRVTLSTAGTYVMTARQNGKTSSIKMVNNGGGNGDGIEYAGVVEAQNFAPLQPKSDTRGNTDNPFNFGDMMEYVGYATVNGIEISSEHISQAQHSSQTFTLLFDVSLPIVTTNAVSDILATSVTLNGEVAAESNTNVTERGFSWGMSPFVQSGEHIAEGNGIGSFSTQLTELAPATNYNVWAYAINEWGTTYGQQQTFRTLDTLPVVTTDEPTDIAATTFTSGGEVLVMNSNSLIACGICWNTAGMPTVADSHTTQSGGLGNFASIATGLDCSTTYYVRAYATNSAGTAYGEEFSVTTLPSFTPEVAIVTADIYNGLNVVIIAEILTENCSAVTSRGICWNTSHNPTILDNYTLNGDGAGLFNDTLNNLEIATTYYVRAFATNDVGTAYSEEMVIITPDFPTVNTASAVYAATSASSGGIVISDGGAMVTARGVCYSTSANPTIADNHTSNGSGTGSFTSILAGLTPSTTYHVRAYATNSVGTAYGNEVIFTTRINDDSYPCTNAPTLTDIDGNVYNTVRIGRQCWMRESLRTTKYSDNTAILQSSDTSTIIAYWDNPVNASPVDYGLRYNWKAVMRDASSSSSNPSGVQGICPIGWHVPSDDEWTQLEAYVSSQSQYVCGDDIRYIVQALATSGWVVYGSDPCLIGHATNATGFSARPDRVVPAYGGTEAWYWSSTKLDSVHVCNRRLDYMSPILLNNSIISTYFCTVRCILDEDPELPVVITTAVTDVNATSAISGGNVTSGADITSKGVCWSASPNPTISDPHTNDGIGTGRFTSGLTELEGNTTYYVRAYATNSLGTSYGNEVVFTTLIVDGTPCPDAPTVTDRSGNTYNTVHIGSQCWMKENLRTTKYADGTSISQGSSTSTTTGYWYYPDNDASNKTTYGLLYNWKAVMRNSSSSSANPSGVQGICPTGWHVPSDAEFTQLTDYVSSQSQYVCGSNNTYIAKALAGTTGWSSSTGTCCVGKTPYQNNSTGFRALPAGYYSGSYSHFGNDAYFWGTTESSSSNASTLNLSYNYPGVIRHNLPKTSGRSVRCLRD